MLALALSLAACLEPAPADDPVPARPAPAPPTPRTPLQASITWPKLDGESESPLTLTASDGTGLRLVSMEFHASILDPLAFTELHLEFDNPLPRTLEGRFEIMLPPGAAVSRFAMEIGGSWQEGEVVEIQAARRAYEDALHRRQDPALLEAAPGNRFQARVFPIPAHGRKKLIVSYSHELDGAQEPYRLMLRGLPHLDHLDGSVVVDSWGGEPQVLEVHQQDLEPAADLEVKLTGPRQAVGLRSGDVAVARVSPLIEGEPAPVHDLTLLIDTSASRALGFEEQVLHVTRLIEILADEAKGDLRLKVACFDQELWPLYEGPASGWGTAQRDALLQRGALGASDLGGALAALAREAQLPPRLLVMTDGVITAGPSEEGPLKAALAALHERGVRRADVLVEGGLRDEQMLHALVTAGLQSDGVVLDAATPVPELARRLALATRSGIEVMVEGASWVWPSHLDGMQSGDDVLVYAQLPEDKPFEVRLAGASLRGDFALSKVDRPLLARAAVRADLERLSSLREKSTEAAYRAELQQKIIDESIQNRVLTDVTAMLVLETDQDYARFGIDRNALTDLLVVGPKGVELQSRRGPVVPGAMSGGCSSSAPTSEPTSAPLFKLSSNPKPVVDTGSAPPVAAPRPGRMGKAKAEAAPDEMLTEDATAAQVAADPGVASADANAAVPDDVLVAEEPPPPPPPPPPEVEIAPSPAPRPSPAPEHGQDGAIRIVRSDEVSERGRATARNREIPAADPYEGKLKEVMHALSTGKATAALTLARSWRAVDPGDVLALVALGEAYEALGQPGEAARAYGSIIDLFPARADLRRMAGERLERLGLAGMPLAADTYARAVAQRPDHPHGHRLLAYALLRLGRAEEAFDVLDLALGRTYPAGRFAEWDRILREDLGLVAAMWNAQEKDPARKAKLEERLSLQRVSLPTLPSLRFVLVWETDANDVDFHIEDGLGGHAFYSSKELPSGGSLYADVTTGYGPECFTIEGTPKAWPYTLQAHYYARGPMGYGMGKLEVLQHDGMGGLLFEERPFVIMKDQAFVDLGRVKGPL